MESPSADYVTAEMDTQPTEGLYSFGLLFATSVDHLRTKRDAMIWVAYPKKSSKLFKDLNRDKGWENFNLKDLSESLQLHWMLIVSLRFRPQSDVKRKTSVNSQVAPDNYVITEEIRETFERESVLLMFVNLPTGYQKQYLEWLLSAKRQETRDKRLVEAVYKLRAGFRQPYGK